MFNNIPEIYFILFTNVTHRLVQHFDANIVNVISIESSCSVVVSQSSQYESRVLLFTVVHCGVKAPNGLSRMAAVFAGAGEAASLLH